MIAPASRGAVAAAPAWVVRTGAGTVLLAGCWVALKAPAVQRADVRVGDAMRGLAAAKLERAVTATTDLGSMYAVAGAAATLAAVGEHDTAFDVLGVGFLAWNVSQLAKTRVRRARPYEADGVRRLIRPPTGSSFPSGHAAVGGAMMAVLADRAATRRATQLFSALGWWVAATRVYAGVHYPTDVLGGAGLGLCMVGLWRGRVAQTGRRMMRFGTSTAWAAGCWGARTLRR